MVVKKFPVNELENEDAKYSIIIPCYNEERAVKETVLDVLNTLAGRSDCRLIIVDDGSSDDSFRILSEMTEQHSNLSLVGSDKNCGYGASLKRGMQSSRSEYIAIIDADGTYPTEKLSELLDLASGYDMVVGARTAKDVEYSKIRKIPKLFLRRYASWIAKQNIPDINSGMRVFRRDTAMRFIRILPDTFSFTTTITLAFLTNYHAVHYVPIGYKARIGRSKIKPIRDTLRFIQLIMRTGMYFAPLRVLLPLIGLLCCSFFASFLYDIFVLDNLTDKTVMLLLFSLNSGMFALLADMIDKRTKGI